MNVTFYHGTTEAHAKSILENGLIPRAAKGAAATSEAYTRRDAKAERAQSVYMSPNQWWGAYFAARVAKAQKQKPALLAVTIPNDAADALHIDEEFSPLASKQWGIAWRYEGTIKPEWIRRADAAVPEILERGDLDEFMQGLFSGKMKLG